MGILIVLGYNVWVRELELQICHVINRKRDNRTMLEKPNHEYPKLHQIMH